MPRLSSSLNHPVAVIGGGPAGLMAAEVIASAGFSVHLYDAMPSVGRKFLLAGVGGMNITHAEDYAAFISRYGSAATWLAPHIDQFNPVMLRGWIHQLGVDTFVGTSGRVFPTDMKAAPLLRAWLHRLRELNVRFFPRHRWLGWSANKELLFATGHAPDDCVAVESAATVLALGGGSWSRLGSDGAWINYLREKEVSVQPLLPSNCGFNCEWSSAFSAAFAGQPLSTVEFTYEDATGITLRRRGEASIAQYGIEGTTIYALSAPLRDAITQHGFADIYVDLRPDHSLSKVEQLLAQPRYKNSMANFLRKQLAMPPLKLALLKERTAKSIYDDPYALAAAIKRLPLRLLAARPLDEAISSAGGIAPAALTEQLMLKKIPGVFCAGEMLDWEAPTGGYLLTACFATGRAAGRGVVEYLQQHS